MEEDHVVGTKRKQREPVLYSDNHLGFVNVIHKHPRFLRITFEEKGHSYSVDWEGNGQFSWFNNKSMTAIIKSYSEPFDAEGRIDNIMANANAIVQKGRRAGQRQGMAKKYRHENGTDMTRAEIKQSWLDNRNNAARAGTQFHKQVERYYNQEYSSPAEYPDTVSFGQFLHFMRDYSAMWEIVLVECPLFDHVGNRVVGTPDGVFALKKQDPDDPFLRVVMVDLKHTPKVTNWGFGKYMKGPLKRYPDSKYHGYMLQQNGYIHLLETHIKNFTHKGKTYEGMRFEQAFLLICHPELPKYSLTMIPINRSPQIIPLLFKRQEENLRRRVRFQNSHLKPWFGHELRILHGICEFYGDFLDPEEVWPPPQNPEDDVYMMPTGDSESDSETDSDREPPLKKQKN